MVPPRDASQVALRVGGVLGILGLALTVFLLLPQRLLFNDFVAGSIFGATILLLSAFARVAKAHRETDGGAEAERGV
jgi:uncharacterized membrane protein